MEIRDSAVIASSGVSKGNTAVKLRYFVFSNVFLPFHYFLCFVSPLFTTLYQCKQGLVDSPGCDKCNQAFETVSHVLCDCEALTVLRFRHLDRHFLQPSDFGDISACKILQFVQSVWLLNVA